MYRSLVFLKILLNSKISKMILETWKQGMVKTWHCPFYGLPANIFLSWRYSLLLLLHVFRGNHWEVFYKSWKMENTWERADVLYDVQLYQKWTHSKLFSWVFTIDMDHAVEGRAFCKKKLFLWSTLQWLLPEAYCQKSNRECFAKIVNG